MGFQVSDYHGDEIFSINTTGDVVKGDEVRFERATFSGSFRNAKFAGFDRITAKVVSESYGAAKQQHTFTLEKENGERIMIKGRNLYKEGVYRKPWANEADRRAVADEKHNRGDANRAIRAAYKFD